MGLDNGVVLNHRPKKEDLRFSTLTEQDYTIGTNDIEAIEVCYWRKCWNIREIFINVLHMKQDEYEHSIEAEDIPAIIRRLVNLLNPDNWDESDSIWTHEEILETLIDNIINLKWLQIYLTDNPDKTAFFYDSY